jgi:hypothetical protein
MLNSRPLQICKDLYIITRTLRPIETQIQGKLNLDATGRSDGHLARPDGLLKIHTKMRFNTGRSDGTIGRPNGPRATSLTSSLLVRRVRGRPNGMRTGSEQAVNGHSGISTGTIARPDDHTVRPDGHSIRSDGLRTAGERACERCPWFLVLEAFYCITSGQENWPSGRSLFPCTLLFHEAVV